MKEHNRIFPPKWATQLLTWYCKPELLEDLQGDLTEYFERNVKSKGVKKAKLIYIIDVLKFFRLYTIRKPAFINLFINYVMIGSYIKTSGRSIVRNKLFSFINVVGLAVSMSVGLVLIGVLSDILSYDRFHVNRDKVYRLISRYEYLGDKGNSFMATTSLRAARHVQENFTGVEEVAMLRSMQGDFKLMYLLGKGFIVLLLISICISMPVIILFFEKVVFPNTANHAPLNVGEMLLGVFAILVLALTMISSQILKVAKANPAVVLKTE